jgi:arylsulfatase A-like enzyme/Tfp pilus assembly protein PilF
VGILRHRTSDSLRTLRRAGAACVAGVLLAAVVWSAACRSGASPDAPDVVLITLDTTRADRLGCYGAKDAETPHLDALAAAGARFDTAITPVPITLPSHATILTGLPPAAHGVHDNVLQRLRDDVPTLATMLKERGYATAAFVGAAVLDERYGLARGFDRYDDDLLDSMKERSPLSFVERRAEHVTGAALAWLDQAPKDRPLLLWVHYFDPHQEYAAPPPFAEKFAERPYDGEIAYVDHWIGELMAGLAKRAAQRPTLSVVVGDHGEGLGEHGEQTHGLFLYDSTLRVPLLMHWPERIPAGAVVTPMASTEEILPTVFELLGVAVPSGVKAKSLLPLLRGERPPLEAVFLETMLPMNLFGWTPIEGIRTAEHKYVESPKPELYDLRDDPREERNLAGTAVAPLAALGERLAAQRRAAPEKAASSEAGALDEATRQRMAALGYAVVPERSGAAERTDPRDLVTLFDSLYAAAHRMGERRWDEAAALLDSVLRLHPRHVGAMINLGEVYWRRALEGATIVTGAATQSAAGGDSLLPVALAPNAAADFASAVEWYERALGVDPSSSPAHFGLGRVHAHRGELDDALARYRRALEIVPDAPEVQNEVAVILIRQGQMEAAVAELERIVGEFPEYAPAHRNLGALYRARGENERALEQYELGARLAPTDGGTRFLTARLLAEMGRLDAAIENYRTAIAIDESDVNSRLGLGDAYLRQGDRAAARTHFETAVRLAPESAPAYFSLGTVDAAEGRLDDAERNYRLALRYNPGLLLAEVRLALIYRKQGKIGLATEALRRAREIAPDDAKVAEMLARIEEESGTAKNAE